MEQPSNREWINEYDKNYNPKLERNNMSLVMKNEGGDFELLPEGTHLATCYMIIDLGDQVTTYQNKESIKPQVMIGWEVTNELMQDGRPFVASRVYNSFFSEKANLRKDLESWRGKKFSDEELEGFDVSKLLNIPCQVTITHSTGEKTYANVSTVTGLPKGVEAPALINDAVIYEQGDEVAYQKLPEWIQKKINNAVKREENTGVSQTPSDPQNEANGGGDIDDEIPF